MSDEGDKPKVDAQAADAEVEAPPRAAPQPTPPRSPRTELGIPVPNLHDRQADQAPPPSLAKPGPSKVTETQTFEAMPKAMTPPSVLSGEQTPEPKVGPANPLGGRPMPTPAGGIDLGVTPMITRPIPEAAMPSSDNETTARVDVPPAPLQRERTLAGGPMPSAIDLPTVQRKPKAAQITSLDAAREVAEKIRARMRHDVMGRDDVIEMVLVALFGDGHVLLEDYPGSGKTTLAKALGHAIVDDGESTDDGLAEFRRIQFTPDLLPSDVTGVMIFDTETNRFEFRRGPVFAYIVLVDEINRTSPKVQAALLESMAEKQVTVDNISHSLDELFFVIATQNPLDSIGTYPLPLAQLDRFLFKIKMDHVDRASELEVLSTWGTPRKKAELDTVTRSQVIQSRQLIRENVHVSKAIHECLVDLAGLLRADKRCLQGVSTRSLVQAIPALQILAVLRGRDFVSADDIEHLAGPLFQHRLALAPGVESATPVIAQALEGPLEALSRSTLKRW
ncbi:MAG: AAA family ATPase [Bradymonadia bacterium]